MAYTYQVGSIVERWGDDILPVNIADERIRQAATSFNGWLELQLEAAFNAGSDYAVTRLVMPDDERPSLNEDTMSWTETMRWQGQQIPPGAEMPATWTVYRRPKGWKPTAT